MFKGSYEEQASRIGFKLCVAKTGFAVTLPTLMATEGKLKATVDRVLMAYSMDHHQTG